MIIMGNSREKHYLLLTFIVTFIIYSNNMMGIVQANNLKFDEVQTIDEKFGEITTVEWSPNGKEFATATSDGKIFIYNSFSGEKIQTIHDHDNYRIATIAWNPNESMIASGSYDNTIKLWNAKTGELIKRVNAHVQCVLSISWSPNGTQLAAGYSSNITQIWDIEKGIILATLRGNEDSILSVRWNPNGSMLATAAQQVRIWNTTTWTTVKVLPERIAVRVAEWSPDGKTLVSEANYFEFTFWDAINWIEIKNSTEQYSMIYSISWNPDNSAFVSGLGNNTALIWDPNNNTPLKLLSGHTDEVTSVDWSPDGKRIITGSRDGTVKIWGELLPDVHLISMTSNKDNILAGEKINLTATLSNNGLGDGFNVSLRFYDGNQFLKERIINITHGTAFNVSMDWVTTNRTALGFHIIRAVLDDDEKNITIDINGIPNVFIKDLMADPKVVALGKTIKFSAVIENNGTADAKNIPVNLLENNVLVDSKQISISIREVRNVIFNWDTNNQSIGAHHFRVLVGTTFKEIIITINPRIKTNIEPYNFCWELIIFLILAILLILIYRLKKNMKKSL
jgi:WD40 repeat protein